MKPTKLVLFYLLFSIISCSTNERKGEVGDEKYIINFQRKKNSETSGSLIIKFIADGIVDYENVELKFAKQLPQTEKVANWVNASPLPPVPLGEKPDHPTIHRPSYMHIFSKLISNREISIKMDAGEYYFVIESFDKLSKHFLFQFGFTSGRIQYAQNHNVIEEYNKLCFSETLSEGFRHFSSCPKINIIAGKITYVNVYISKSLPITFTTRLLRWGPLAFFFTDENATTYREMRVELVNPTEDAKDQMDNMKINEMH
ncbi:MAG: hypothetical protein KBA66_24340 [Leptospiraceae bacterium]|nr:hypothetical protein [Leptospiraceae bacterium]